MLTHILLWVAIDAPASEDDGCSLRWSGQVVEAGSDQGIPAARLTYRNRGKPARRVVTDGQGHFDVQGLCPGKLDVSVAQTEHRPTHLTLELDSPHTQSALALAALHEHHSDRVIVVHGNGQNSIAASESIAGAELQRSRGKGLADTLADVSGVAVLRSAAGGMGKPIIRGQLGRRNLILVDGVRHEGQDWGLDHAPEVDPGAAGRITVIKGAATTRYGPKANGGVVLLESRPLLRSPGVAGEVGGFWVSNALGGGGAARVDYAPRRGRGVAMRVEGNLARQRAALTPDYPLDNTGAWTWNVGARLGYLSDRVDVDTSYRLMRSRLGICSCMTLSSGEAFSAGADGRRLPGSEAYSPEFAIDRPKQEITHHLATTRARVALARAGELHATYAFQFDRREEFDVVRADITGPQLRFGLATHLAELNLEHPAARLGKWSLLGSLGVTLGHQRNRFEAATTLIPDYDQWTWGVYDVERFVHERVEVEFGFRYDGTHRAVALNQRDYLGQKAGGRIDAGRCTDQGSGGRCEFGFHSPSGTVGVLVRPFRRVPRLSWRTRLDSSARVPAIDEQFMNGAAPSFPILGFGSSRIGVERTWGGESTLRYDGDWITVQGSGYSSWIHDYIAFVPQPQYGACAPLTCTTRGAFPVFVFDATNALFGGGEVSFDLVAPGLPLTLSGNAAWVRARNLSDQTFLPLVPADRYGLIGRWLWPDTKVSSRGYLEVRGTVVARQTRTDPELDFAAPPQAYFLLGAGLGVEFPRPQHIIHTSLVGTNLLNMRYREYTSLLRYFADEPGWGLQFRLSVEFDVAAG